MSPKESPDAGDSAEVQAGADDMQNAVMRAQEKLQRENERRWISQLNELAHAETTLKSESPDGLTWMKTSGKLQRFLTDKSHELMHSQSDAWPTTTPEDRALAGDVLDLIKLRNELMRSMKEIQIGLDGAPNSKIERTLVRELDLIASQLEDVDEQLSDAQRRRRLTSDDE